MIIKICKECKKELPKTEFYVASGYIRDSKCKNCRKAYNRAYQNKRNKLKFKSLW